LENGVEVVILRYLVPLLETARDATMKNGVFSTLEFYTHGLHESSAHCLTIARIHINVFAPQTLRAVVSVTTTLHKETALFTSEVLLGTLEFLGSSHVFVSVFWLSKINISL